MFFVTSDLHGYPLEQFRKLLDAAGFGEDDELYVLGDVIDRHGDGGVKTLLWMMEQPNVTLIKGNHEAMLLSCDFLFDTVTDESLEQLDRDQMEGLSRWLFNGAKPTLDSLSTLNATFPEQLADLLDYLREAPLYAAVSAGERDFILTHAGLGSFRPGRKLSQYAEHDLLWHRPDAGDRYFPDVTVVFGHTPTQLLEGGQEGRMLRTDTWIDVDTGAAGGGAPMVLRLDDLTAFYADGL